MPDHYLNHYRPIINSTLRNNLQCKFDQDTKIFFREYLKTLSAKCLPFCLGFNVMQLVAVPQVWDEASCARFEEIVLDKALTCSVLQVGSVQIWIFSTNYCQTSNISCTLVGNKIVDHSDVVGRRCSNYIFILDLTHGFNGLGKGNCKMKWEIFSFWDLVCLVIEVWQYSQ